MHTRFSPLGDINSHFWLTLGMARAVGVNLNEAVHNGQITRSQYADIVTRCRGCEIRGTCTQWLAKQTTIADEVPTSCENHDIFVALRRGEWLADRESLPT